MELTNIFGKIGKKYDKPRRFIAIEISQETVKTAIWQVVNRKTHVISTGTVEEWKGNTPEDLLTAVDVSLSKSLEPVDPEPNEVIFGLPESWIKQDAIVDTKKPFLKILAQKLELKPVGFVVSTEALAHYLKEQEGGPPTAILLYLTETEVAVTLVRLGKIVGTQTVGRSEDLGTDVEEGLARFSGVDSLPSRMLLYDGNIDLESAKQVLLSYNWQEKLPFLHFPKIDSLSNDITIKSVAIAGGAEVAKSLGFDIRGSDKESTTSADESKSKENIPDKAEEFGFTPSLSRPAPPESKTPPEPVKTQAKAETVVNVQPITDTKLEVDHKPTPKSPPEPPKTTSPLPQSSKMGNIFTKFKNLFSHQVTLPQLPASLPPFLPIGIGLFVLLFLALFIAYWNIPTALVTVYLDPKIIDQEIKFTLDPSTSVLEVETNTVPANQDTVEVTGSKEAETTGDKLVGESATGQVKLYNNTTSPKTLSAGTKLTDDSDHKFTLDSEVNIASASTEKIGPGEIKIKAGEATAPVTAAAIGSEYNISENTSLQVSDFTKTSFEAIATGTFEGGSSRQIQAVSKEDQENLLDSLKEELNQKAIDKLSFRADEIQGVISTDEVEIIEEEYSADVDDEIKILKLTLKVSLQAYTYQIENVNLLVEGLLSDSIPDTYSLDKQASEIEVLDTSFEDDEILKVEAKAKAKLVPQLDPADIAKNIKGKYPPATENYFSSLPNFSKIETQIKPQLPGKLGTFPRRIDHITVEIKLKEN